MNLSDAHQILEAFARLEDAIEVDHVPANVDEAKRRLWVALGALRSDVTESERRSPPVEVTQ